MTMDEEQEEVPKPPSWDLAKLAIFFNAASGVLLGIVLTSLALVDVFHAENTREATKLLLMLVMLFLVAITILLVAFLLAVIAWLQGHGSKQHAMIAVTLSLCLGIGSVVLLVVLGGFQR